MLKTLATLTCTAALFLSTGCSKILDEITLSSEEIDALELNMEQSVEVQNQILDMLYATSTGELDWQTFFDSYTPPAGGEPGVLTVSNGAFPFGTGDMTVSFQLLVDGVPVDPFTTEIDDGAEIDLTANFSFTGVDNQLANLDVDGDVNLTGLYDDDAPLTDVSANGDVDVELNGYDLEATFTDVVASFDTDTAELTSLVGDISGTIDIPNFVLDADFSIEGLGATLDVLVEALDSLVQFDLTVDLPSGP